MRKQRNAVLDFLYLVYRWVVQVVDPVRLVMSVPGYLRYFISILSYRRMPSAEPIHIRDTFPIIYDATQVMPFDSHYFYQAVWAFSRIQKQNPVPLHLDVASQISFASLLSQIVRVAFLDLRPLQVKLDNFVPVKASILNLPIRDASVLSITCLHVVEHIGLGRYGDPLDPLGTVKSLDELIRVLAPGGDLFLSLPIGKSRLCFNSHRIHSPGEIIGYLKALQLVEFSIVDDSGNYLTDENPDAFEGAAYACGLFWFVKPEVSG